MVVVRTESLKKYYGSGQSLVKAVDGVNLTVEKGEFVSIVGTSGSGKSTLLHLIGGLDHPTGGRVFIEGKDISAMNNNKLAVFRRRKIGFIFQAYNLIPVLNKHHDYQYHCPKEGNRHASGGRAFRYTTWEYAAA